MKIGTKTILFGVHQFLWHPFTIWRAWRWLYGSNPTWFECVAIFCHDLGYRGKPNLDGPEGKTHPMGGAKLAGRIVFKLGYWRRYLWYRLKGIRAEEASGAAIHFSVGPMVSTFVECVGHSREHAKMVGVNPGKLCWADKACIFFDPPWLYLFRARLAGELPEFKQNAEPYIGKVSDEDWLRWYRARVMSVLAREVPSELNRALHRRAVSSPWDFNECSARGPAAVRISDEPRAFDCPVAESKGKP